jgi:hypothetical protein
MPDREREIERRREKYLLRETETRTIGENEEKMQGV